MENTNNFTTHQLEEIKGSLSATIFSNSQFIGSYLSEKLLELPLSINFVSEKDLEGIKHLNVNKKFSFNLVENFQEDKIYKYKKSSYYFQIINFSEGQEAIKRHLDLTKIILKNIQNSDAKYQLVALNCFSEAGFSLSEIFDNFQDSIKKDEIIGFLHFLEIINQESKKHSLNTRSVILVDVYGPNMEINDSWELPIFLRAILSKQPFKISGEGLLPLFPVNVSDAASAIVKTMLSEAHKNKKLLIAGKQQISTLNLAYKIREILLKQLGELTEIHYGSEKKDIKNNNLLNARLSLKDEIGKKENTLNFEPLVDLETGLHQTIDWLRKTKPISSSDKAISRVDVVNKTKISRENITSIKKAENRFKKKKILLLAVFFFLLVFITPFLIFSSVVGLGSYRYYQSINLLKTENFKSAEISAKKAADYFKSARSLYRVFPLNIFNLYLKGEKKDFDNILSIAHLSSKTLEHFARASVQGEIFKNIFFGNTRGSIKEHSSNLSTELTSIYKLLSSIESELSGDNNSSVLKFMNSSSGGVIGSKETLKKYKTMIGDSLKIIDLIPEIIGAEKKLTYLVLLQNNAELRATGGFIGSYAIISFENSRITSLKVDDVYSIDGQLKGHVEPPLEIKTYLGEAGWYLRDANWDPNFPTSAKQIEWFYEKETKENVDGVIAINLYVIQEILKIIEPLNIPDYSETITADNLFKISEYYSEVNFFPGSTQKKDFLGSLANSIFFKLQNASSLEVINSIKAVYNSLERGQMLIFLHDRKIQKSLNEFGWDGSLKQVRCSQSDIDDSCNKTFISIRESNVGVNKVNYFIRRTLDLQQNINLENIRNTLNISYLNQSQQNKWPGGTYQNYLRIYLDSQAKVESVKVNSKLLNTSQVSLKSEHGKLIIGFLVEVPPQKQKDVQITFTVDDVFLTSNHLKSSILFQKQPGTENDPLSITISAINGLSLFSTNTPADFLEENKFLFSQLFERDINLIIDFNKIE